MNILAVDDSESIRELVGLVLKATDSVDHVLTVDNGEAALAALENTHYDLILVDWFMQPMCGVDLIEMIRLNSKYRQTPIIVLSADQDPGTRKLAKQAGASGWICKPFHPVKLQQLVLSFHPNKE